MYQIDFDHPIHIYFIGIGGISMSGLAEILLSEGFQVSGSDWNRSALTERLESQGACIHYGKPQKAENITDDIDLVVYTAYICSQFAGFLQHTSLERNPRTAPSQHLRIYKHLLSAELSIPFCRKFRAPGQLRFPVPGIDD